MKIVVVAVGKVKDKPLRAALDEYFGRVRRYVACEEIEIADGKPQALEAAFVKATKEATIIALEIGEKMQSSEAFAKSIERLGARGKGTIAFLIGGADGIPAAISRAAFDRWSLSPLTFPHRLARLVLIEQIYRAMTILKNEPYAH